MASNAGSRTILIRQFGGQNPSARFHPLHERTIRALIGPEDSHVNSMAQLDVPRAWGVPCRHCGIRLVLSD
jgi:hypothetical protein